MSRATVNTGVELEYDTFGDPSDQTVLLVCGFTMQMINWSPEFCELLAAEGLHVVRYDNRDCGLSTKFTGNPDARAVMAALHKGVPAPDVPYTLSDMAADGIGLLDHLGVATAAVLGVSMGGMIAQTMAIEHPARVSALISVMSTTGDLDVGKPTAEALAVLLASPPADRQAYIDSSVDALVWASKRYGSAELVASKAAAAYDRSFWPEGAPRQLAAIYASGDRSEALTELTVPTLVIHGRDDTLIAPDGGVRTAALIPTADLLLLADMGHDLPEPLWPVIVSAVAAKIEQAARLTAV